jgi:hypothetical protein
MRKIQIARITPGKFDLQVLTQENTKRLEVDDNGNLSVVLLNGDEYLIKHWEAIKLEPEIKPVVKSR